MNAESIRSHRDEAEDALGIVDRRTWPPERDGPLGSELVVVLLRARVVFRVDHGHSLPSARLRYAGLQTHRGEVARADDVDPDAQVSSRKLRRELVRERDGGCLGGVVVELAPLRRLGDAAHGGQVNDVSRLREAADRLGGGQEGQEGKRGEVVRGRVDLVRLEPGLDALVIEHLGREGLGRLLDGVDVGAAGRDAVVCV